MNPRWPYPQYPVPPPYSSQPLQQTPWNIQDANPVPPTINTNVLPPSAAFTPVSFPFHVPPPNIVSTNVPPPALCPNFAPPNYPIPASHSSQLTEHSSLSLKSPPPLPSESPPPLPSEPPPPLPPASPPPLPIDSPSHLPSDSSLFPIQAELASLASSALALDDSSPSAVPESSFHVSTQTTVLTESPTSSVDSQALLSVGLSSALSNNSLQSAAVEVLPAMSTISSPVESTEFLPPVVTKSLTMTLIESSTLPIESLPIMPSRLLSKEDDFVPVQSSIVPVVSATCISADSSPVLIQSTLSSVLNSPVYTVSNSPVVSGPVSSLSSVAPDSTFSSVAPDGTLSSVALDSTLSTAQIEVLPLMPTNSSHFELAQFSSPVPTVSLTTESSPLSTKSMPTMPSRLLSTHDRLSVCVESSVSPIVSATCVSTDSPVLIQSPSSALNSSAPTVTSQYMVSESDSSVISVSISSSAPTKLLPSKSIISSPVELTKFSLTVPTDSLNSIQPESLPSESIPTMPSRLLSTYDKPSVCVESSVSPIVSATCLLTDSPVLIQSPSYALNSSAPAVTSQYMVSESDSSVISVSISSSAPTKLLPSKSIISSPVELTKFSLTVPTDSLNSIQPESLPSESIPTMSSRLLCDQGKSSVVAESSVATTCISTNSSSILNQAKLSSALNSSAFAVSHLSMVSESVSSVSNVVPNNILSSAATGILPSKFTSPVKSAKFPFTVPAIPILTESLSEQGPTLLSNLLGKQGESSVLDEFSVAPVAATCVSNDSSSLLHQPKLLSSVVSNSSTSTPVTEKLPSMSTVSSLVKLAQFSSIVSTESLTPTATKSSLPTQSLPNMAAMPQQTKSSVPVESSIAPIVSSTCASTGSSPILIHSTLSSILRSSASAASSSIPASKCVSPGQKKQNPPIYYVLVPIKFSPQSVSPAQSNLHSVHIQPNTTLTLQTSKEETSAFDSPHVTSPISNIHIEPNQTHDLQSSKGETSTFNSPHVTSPVSNIHIEPNQTSKGEASAFNFPHVTSPESKQGTISIAKKPEVLVSTPVSPPRLIKNEESAFIHFAEAMVSQPLLPVNTTTSPNESLQDISPSEDRDMNFLQWQVMQEHNYCSVADMNENSYLWTKDNSEQNSQQPLPTINSQLLATVIARDHDYCLPSNEPNHQSVFKKKIQKEQKLKKYVLPESKIQQSELSKTSSQMQVGSSFSKKLSHNLFPTNDKGIDDSNSKICNSDFKKDKTNLCHKIVESKKKDDSGIEIEHEKENGDSDLKIKYEKNIAVSEQEIKHVKSQSEIFFSNKSGNGIKSNNKKLCKNICFTDQQNCDDSYKKPLDSNFSDDKIDKFDSVAEPNKTKDSDSKCEDAKENIQSKLSSFNVCSISKFDSHNEHIQKLSSTSQENQNNKTIEHLNSVEKSDDEVEDGDAKFLTKVSDSHEDIYFKSEIFEEQNSCASNNSLNEPYKEGIYNSLSTGDASDVTISDLFKNRDTSVSSKDTVPKVDSHKDQSINVSSTNSEIVFSYLKDSDPGNNQTIYDKKYKTRETKTENSDIKVDIKYDNFKDVMSNSNEILNSKDSSSKESNENLISVIKNNYDDLQHKIKISDYSNKQHSENGLSVIKDVYDDSHHEIKNSDYSTKETSENGLSVIKNVYDDSQHEIKKLNYNNKEPSENGLSVIKNDYDDSQHETEDSDNSNKESSENLISVVKNNDSQHEIKTSDYEQQKFGHNKEIEKSVDDVFAISENNDYHVTSDPCHNQNKTDQSNEITGLLELDSYNSKLRDSHREFDSIWEKSNSIENLSNSNENLSKRQHSHFGDNKRKKEHRHRKRKHIHSVGNRETKDHNHLTEIHPTKELNHSTESCRIKEIGPSHISRRRREHSHLARSHKKSEHHHSVKSPRKSKKSSSRLYKSPRKQLLKDAKRHSSHIKKTMDEQDDRLLQSTKSFYSSRSPESIKNFNSHRTISPESIKNYSSYHIRSPESIKNYNSYPIRSPESIKNYNAYYIRSPENIKKFDDYHIRTPESIQNYNSLRTISPESNRQHSISLESLKGNFTHKSRSPKSMKRLHDRYYSKSPKVSEQLADNIKHKYVDSNNERLQSVSRVDSCKEREHHEEAKKAKRLHRSRHKRNILKDLPPEVIKADERSVNSEKGFNNKHVDSNKERSQSVSKDNMSRSKERLQSISRDNISRCKERLQSISRDNISRSKERLQSINRDDPSRSKERLQSISRDDPSRSKERLQSVSRDDMPRNKEKLRSASRDDISRNKEKLRSASRDDISRSKERLQSVSRDDISRKERLSSVSRDDVSRKERLRSVSRDDISGKERLSSVSRDNVSRKERLRSVSRDDISRKERLSSVSRDDVSRKERLRSVSRDDISRKERLSSVSRDDVSRKERLQSVSRDDISRKERLQSISRDDVSRKERLQSVSRDDISRKERLQSVSRDDVSRKERLQSVSRDDVSRSNAKLQSVNRYNIPRNKKRLQSTSRDDLSKNKDRHHNDNLKMGRRCRSRRRSSTPKDLPCLSLKAYKYVCSTPADDYYYSKEKDSKEVIAKDALKALHEKFRHELVERAERIRASKPRYDPPKRKTKLRKPKPPKTDSNSDSSSSSEKSSSEEEDTSMEELERKKKHPYRLHLELWFNDPKEMNDGPLCRCSAKARRAGIRHGIYVGEDHLPLCNPFSNNVDRLYHYRITMTPHTNFLTKNPTTIYHSGQSYRFEGFSMFSHLKLPPLPNCKVIRFNYEYTIVYAEEEFPKNFTVEGLELFSNYLLVEILELVDLNWKAHDDPDGCPRFHFMPRFTRELKDGGKELLSHCYVLDYLLKQNQILVDEKKLSKVLSLNNLDWQDLADEVKGMIITCPGMKPSSIRVDQLDREQCLPDKEEFPVIVHFGVRPPQLSYAGNPHYQKAWRDYVKYRHLLANKPKVRYADRHKLLQKEVRLQEMRMENDLKRDVTVVISSKDFYKTGMMSDVVQHAMLLPVLVCHLRFHQSLTHLENKLGYKFQDRFLLQLALTHPSYRENFGTNPDHARNSLTNCGLRQPQYGDRRIHYMNTRKRGINTLINIMSRFGSRTETLSRINHNERLEFLGDAVVEFLSSIHLFYMFPDLEEGGLATYRAAIVQNQHLAVLSKKLELDRFMLYAHGSDLCHDLELRHAMANCFEALMGALFLDNGIEIADKVFSKTLFLELELLEVWMNFSPHPLQEQEPGGDRKWIESVPLLQKLHKFEETIGIEFNHIRLLARALTHRSLGYNNLTLGSNQRLEFLGDTVLQLVASEYLYKFFPEHHEGHLSLLRSSLVNNRTQAVVCADLGMVDYAIYPYDKVELKPKDKADLLEAFLGALYVDKDLGYCRKFCEVCFFPRLQDFIMNQDWNDPKSKLQQCCLTLRSMDGGEPDIPTYKVIECKGPTNTRVYSVAVYFQGNRLAVGSGHSIQQAEMDAASNALNMSKDLFPQLRHQRRAIERSLKKRPLNKNKFSLKRDKEKMFDKSKHLPKKGKEKIPGKSKPSPKKVKENFFGKIKQSPKKYKERMFGKIKYSPKKDKERNLDKSKHSPKKHKEKITDKSKNLPKKYKIKTSNKHKHLSAKEEKNFDKHKHSPTKKENTSGKHNHSPSTEDEKTSDKSNYSSTKDAKIAFDNSKHLQTKDEEKTCDKIKSSPAKQKKISDKSNHSPTKDEEKTCDNIKPSSTKDEEKTSDKSNHSPTNGEENTSDYYSKHSPAKDEEKTCDNIKPSPTKDDEMTCDNIKPSPTKDEENTSDKSKHLPKKDEEKTSEQE